MFAFKWILCASYAIQWLLANSWRMRMQANNFYIYTNNMYYIGYGMQVIVIWIDCMTSVSGVCVCLNAWIR